MRRRPYALVLAMLLMTSAARAAFSPGLEQLQAQWEAGQPLQIDLRAQALQARDIVPLSQEVLADWLPKAVLRLTLAQDQEALSLTMDGQPLLNWGLWRQGEEQVVALQDMAWRTGTGTDPMQQLLDLPPVQVPDLEALSAAVQPLWAQLAPLEKRVKQSTVLKNAGTARETLVYELAPEQALALWRQAAAVREDAPSWLRGALPEALTFDKGLTVKRYLDGEGLPLGFSVTGAVGLPDGSSRKVDLLAAQAAGKGFHLTLRAPAARGNDTLVLQLSLQEQEGKTANNLTGDLRWQHRSGEKNTTAQGTLKLRSRVTESGEDLSGRLRLTWREKGQSEERVELEPELTYADGRLQGTVQLTRGRSSQVLLELPLTVSAGPVTGLQTAPEGGPMPEGQALEAARQQVLEALMRPWMPLLDGLSEGQRTALLHDIGRLERTRGESVAPLGEAQPLFDYTVVEGPTSEEVIP